ncbi:hypothetical protein NQ318_009810 [Aromia moschata]|uniref:Uncharacterized protein n=1 Tax=Aromia moschata TaxID=1265417 RepID=A0AAV8XM98_9CUCU|nr:hypothetical protein NQ318_009810 [Aromia moschata]
MLFVGVLFSANAVPRPHYILPCSISKKFNECALKNAAYAIPFLLHGDKQLKIPSMNPLKIPLVDLKGANQFHLKIINMEVYGLGQVVPLSVNADFDQGTLDVNSTVDALTILGDYEIEGKIMMFPLTGAGRLNITLCEFILFHPVQ